MTEDPVAVALKFGFLIVLYLFLLWVARSATRDLATHDDVSVVCRGPGAGGEAQRATRPGPDLRAGVHAAARGGRGDGARARDELRRSGTAARRSGARASADIEVDDPFASSAHARIFAARRLHVHRGHGSTNGTYLNGRQLRQPEQLKMADSVRIGDTEYRYQE